MASMKCVCCRDLDFRELGNSATGSKEERPSINISVSEFQAKCTYCSLLQRMMLHFAPYIEQYEKATLCLNLEESCAVLAEFMGVDPKGDRSVASIVRFYFYIQEKQHHEELPSLGRLGIHSSHSDSDECFRFTQSKLDICSSSHDKCQQSAHPPLPKRVLSIGRCSSDGIKLLDTDDRRAAYASLSHCWGSSHPIETRTANLAQMLQGISWSSLPDVYQDAIRVCHRLRLEYLWIDSLCIIQDNKDDWELESSKMCDYYEHARVTISAASSFDATIPFLTRRDPRWQTHKFNLVTKDGENIEICARRDYGSSFTNHVEGAGPLASRAWVWQETLLSTRILHFTQSELIWECKSDVCAEDGIRPRGLYSMRLPQQLIRCEKDPYNGWHNLISTYSVRQLTYESDRLPALSGVAAKISAWTQSDYLAGLWKKNMPLDLCWSVDYQISSASVPQVSPSQYIAPSWAWPSVRGAIFFNDENPKQPFTPLAVVKEVICNVSGLNLYGQVSYGRLVLRGPVAHILVTCIDPQDCWTYTIGNDPETREPLTPDCVLVETNGSVRRAIGSDICAPFSIALPCILVGRDGSEAECFYYVMVLGKTGVNEYTRLGFASLEEDDWFRGAGEESLHIA